MRLALSLASLAAIFCGVGAEQNREIGFLFSTTVRETLVGTRTSTNYSLGF